MSALIIAHDLGTSGNKASLHREDGTIIATATASYPTHYDIDTTSEQNPLDWWRAVVSTTRELVARADGDIVGLCVSGQMTGAVFLDAHGAVVRPAMIWSDSRATLQASRLTDAVGAAESFRMTGHRVAASYTLPKIMWVRDNEPEHWAQTAHVCVAKDYVNYRLTGRLVTEHSDASSTAAYDLETGTWSDAMLAAAGVDRSVFPEIVASTDVIGTLSAEAAEALGLPQSTRVVAGGGDGVMASVAAGCISVDAPGYVCLGTSAWYCKSTTERVPDPEQRAFTYRHAVPGLLAPCATTQAGAGSLAWLTGAVTAPGGTAPTPAELIAEAVTVTASDDGIFFLPYLIGERTPWWDSNASGVFAGLRPTHGRPQLARAAMEGTAFALALCRDALGEGQGDRPVSVIGGGSRSDEWLQLMADIWGVQVQRRSVRADANGLGAAITGLVGLGLAEFSQVLQVSKVDAEFNPAPGHERYRAHLDRFADLYRALAGWFTPGGEQP